MIVGVPSAALQERSCRPLRNPWFRRWKHLSRRRPPVRYRPRPSKTSAPGSPSRATPNTRRRLPSKLRLATGSSSMMFSGRSFPSAPAAVAAACSPSDAMRSTIARWGKARRGWPTMSRSKNRPATSCHAPSPMTRGIARAILPSCAPKSWWPPASKCFFSMVFAARPSCPWPCGTSAARAAS